LLADSQRPFRWCRERDGMTDRPSTYSPYHSPVEHEEPGSSHPNDPWLPPSPQPETPRRQPRRGVALLVATAVAAGLVGGGTGAALTAALDDHNSSTVV